MNIKTLLQGVQAGTIDINTASEQLKNLPYEELDFAKLDHHRKLRSGFGEVIYCSGKTDAQLISIFQAFQKQNVNVLGTRATIEQFQAISSIIPNIQYNETSRLLQYAPLPLQQKGLIAICTGGTSDIPVAEEAAQTAEFLGNRVDRIYDVGIAGIHRLLSKMEQIQKANCIIAVAGMEGALPSVIAGLVDKPVIAVPTSIGYGANFQGLSALLTMLNSCAEGVAVVNIDNGFGAGYLASQINLQ